MSVIRVDRIGSRSAKESGSDGTFPVRFKVFCNSPTDQSPNVLASPLLPRYGDALTQWEPTLPNAINFRCIDRTAVDSDGPMIHTVECVFSTKFSERADKDLPPLDRRATAKFETRDVTVAWTHDAITGELVTNAAGDQFAGLTTEIEQVVWTIEFNAPSLSAWMHPQVVTLPDGRRVTRKRINSTTVVIRGQVYAAHSLLLDRISIGEERWNQNQTYFPITVTLIGDPRTHERKLLNQGFYELPGGDLLRRRRCRVNDQVAEEMQLLRLNGEQIPQAEIVANPTTAATFIDNHDRQAVEFNAFLPPVG